MGCLSSKPRVEAFPLSTNPVAAPPLTPLDVTQSPSLSRPISSSPAQFAVTVPKDERPPALIADAEDLGPQLTKIGPQAAKQGVYSEVWLGTLGPNGKQVAIKCLRAVDVAWDPHSKDAKERLEKCMKREMRVWLPLKHPRILECIGYAMIDQRPSLVNTWCKHGNAREYLDAHPDCNRRAMVAQVAEGLVYLHDRKHPIVHGDVKLPNIMIGDDGKAMLTDFGVAKVVDQLKTRLETVSTPGNTLKYSSPEALAGEYRNVKMDVYSFACVALEIITEKAPFYKLKDPPVVVQAKEKGQMPYPWDYPDLPVGNPLWGVPRKCWSLDPDKRPTMQEVLNKLNNLGYRA